MGRGDECDKHSSHECDRAFHLRHARSITRSRWVPSSLEGTPRALEDALTTSLVPSGRSAMRSRMRWRSCRLTRLRPLARLISRLGTTKPTRGLLRSSSARTWTTTSGSPARAPCRIAAVKSAGSTMRCARGSAGCLRRTAWHGPCDGGQPEWRGRRGSTCADGSRASWNDAVVGLEGPLGGHGNSPRRGVVSHSYRLGYRAHGDAIAGTHARNGAQTSSKTKRTGAPSQRGESTHRVTHSFHSCGNRCGATPSTAVDDESYPQVVCHFAFRRLPRTHSCNYRRVIL